VDLTRAVELEGERGFGLDMKRCALP